MDRHADAVRDAVRRALAEDLGDLDLSLQADVTSRLALPEAGRGRARMLAKQAGSLAGMECATDAFSMLDPECRIERLAADGERVAPGQLVLEVEGLMRIFGQYIRKKMDGLRRNDVRVRFIGDRVRLEKSLIKMMDDLEEMTRDNTRVHLTVALNYGGRDEVARATKRLARDVAAGKLDPESVDEQTLTRYLDTCLLPDPDLVIRTSGEARISNFLLWQSAYAEYEFTPILWPDFTAGHFADILLSFGGRERRFGAVLT